MLAGLEIEGARFAPCMDSFLGAAKGVLETLGEALSFAELWGLSGRAFRLQVHRKLSPLGLLPRQWDVACPRMLRRLGFDSIAGLRDHFYSEEDLFLLQAGWMRNIERQLQEGRPAIAFGLHGPAFGIIRGFDDRSEDYVVSTCFDGSRAQRLNAQALGSLHPPCIFVLIPSGPLPGYERAAAAREALREALAPSPKEDAAAPGHPFAPPETLASGLEAYSAWFEALAAGDVEPHWGAACTAGYYVEARTHGAGFLKHAAAQWFPERAKPLKQAAGYFAREAEAFKRLANLFPMRPPALFREPSRVARAAACLNEARSAYRAAQEALREAVA